MFLIRKSTFPQNVTVHKHKISPSKAICKRQGMLLNKRCYCSQLDGTLTYNANSITFDNNIQPDTYLIPLHVTWQRFFFCLPMANYIVHLPLPLEKADKKI